MLILGGLIDDLSSFCSDSHLFNHHSHRIGHFANTFLDNDRLLVCPAIFFQVRFLEWLAVLGITELGGVLVRTEECAELGGARHEPRSAQSSKVHCTNQRVWHEAVMLTGVIPPYSAPG